MVVVVGPSGAGKDTIISQAWPALKHLGNIHLVKRVVTRPVDPARENHHSVSKDEFRQKSQNGDFSVEWSAHNLLYGIPASTLQQTSNGDILIANGSRAAVNNFRAKYPRCLVILITAPAEVLATRLVKRKAESIDEITNRLKRSVSLNMANCDIVINNDGKVEQSVKKFVDAVLSVHTIDPNCADHTVEHSADHTVDHSGDQTADTQGTNDR